MTDEPKNYSQVCVNGLQAHKRADCPFVKESYSGMDGERYRCSECGYSYFLDYEEMR